MSLDGRRYETILEFLHDTIPDGKLTLAAEGGDRRAVFNPTGANFHLDCEGEISGNPRRVKVALQISRNAPQAIWRDMARLKEGAKSGGKSGGKSGVKSGAKFDDSSPTIAQILVETPMQAQLNANDLREALALSMSGLHIGTVHSVTMLKEYVLVLLALLC